MLTLVGHCCRPTSSKLNYNTIPLPIVYFVIQVFDFELNPEEVEAMRALDKGESGRIFNFFFWKGYVIKFFHLGA